MLSCQGNLRSSKNPQTRQTLDTSPPQAADGSVRGQVRVENGILMYRAKDEYEWQHAVYHHDIRDKLIAESPQGHYTVPRAKGKMANDITSFHPDYTNWGPDRNHRPDILYQYMKMNYISPAYTPETLYDDNRIVLDMDDNPIKKWQELPLVLSSEFEGFMMEGIHRLYRNITIRDFRARMPKFIYKGRNFSQRDIYCLSTLGMRMSRFRLKACCISWAERDGGDSIKDYIDKIIPRKCYIENSTKGFRDLTPYEIADATTGNKGAFLSRAGTSALDEKTRSARRSHHQKRLIKLKEKHDARLENMQANLESSLSPPPDQIQKRKRTLDTSSDREEGNYPLFKRRNMQLSSQELSSNPTSSISYNRSHQRAPNVLSGLEYDNKILTMKRIKRQNSDSIDNNSLWYHPKTSPFAQTALTSADPQAYLTSSRLPTNLTGYSSSTNHPGRLSQVVSKPLFGQDNSRYGILPDEFDTWDAPGDWDDTMLLENTFTTNLNYPVGSADPQLKYEYLHLGPVLPGGLEPQPTIPGQFPGSEIIDSDFAKFAQYVDFSNIAPSDAWEEVSIIAALHYTREDFHVWTGMEAPVTFHKSSYMAQYNHLQAIVASIWASYDVEAPTLFRLEPWGTGIRHWEAPLAEDGTLRYLPANWAALGGVQ